MDWLLAEAVGVPWESGCDPDRTDWGVFWEDAGTILTPRGVCGALLGLSAHKKEEEQAYFIILLLLDTENEVYSRKREQRILP